MFLTSCWSELIFWYCRYLVKSGCFDAKWVSWGRSLEAFHSGLNSHNGNRIMRMCLECSILCVKHGASSEQYQFSSSFEGWPGKQSGEDEAEYPWRRQHESSTTFCSTSVTYVCASHGALSLSCFSLFQSHGLISTSPSSKESGICRSVLKNEVSSNLFHYRPSSSLPVTDSAV